MAQTTAVVATGPIQDVSRPHTSSSKLEDQAAVAALYVTKYDKSQGANKSKSGYDVLDHDNRLSSAGESRCRRGRRGANPR